MNDDFEVLRKILNSRYSCRGYLEKPVAADDIKDIVAAASRVPTWCNAQPWHVIVTSGEATTDFARKLVKAAQSDAMAPDFDWPTNYTGVYKERRRVCGFQLYDSLGIQRDDRAQRDAQMMLNFEFFGAPHVAIVTTEKELGAYGAMDCAGFIAGFTLAATAKGISTIAQASVTGFAPMIREHFDIPENRLIQTAISFGYEDPAHPANNFRTTRAEITDVLTIVES